MRVVWIALGLMAVGLGILGLALPLLPTTPFMLLAAGCFAKSSPRLHGWLIDHRIFGPAIRNWQVNRAISTKAKRMALTAMAAAFGVSVFFGVPYRILAVQAVVLLITGTWIATRPSGS